MTSPTIPFSPSADPSGGGGVLFVVGTGTDVGKTAATGALLRAAGMCGLAAQAVKPVQTGCRPLPGGGRAAPDAEVYREAAAGYPALRGLSLVELMEPCSPHLAARLEDRRLTAAELAGALRRTAAERELTLVEGAGGLLVPLNEHETLADLAVLLGAPVVLVLANVLGAVNHALLTLEALRARGLAVAAVLATQPEDDGAGRDGGLSETIARDNLAILESLGGLPPPVALPHQAALRGGAPAARLAAWDELARRLVPSIARLRDLAGPARAGPEPGGKEAREPLESPGSDEAARRDDASGLLAFDRAHIWHPYAAIPPRAPVWEAVETRGTRIRLRDGRWLTDGMSSWWSAAGGYNRPELLEALTRQARRMPHVMFGGFTHRPAVDLARRLLAGAPAGLEKVFFVDSGSVAVEAAAKMAWQYQRALGRTERRLILSHRGGYHGDTLGAMSLCDPVTGMHTLFRGVLPRQVFAPRPECRFGAPFDPASLAGVEECFARHEGRIAAVSIEPIVQGAGGMWFYHPEYLRRLRRLCDARGVLLLCDEIATGFGRTGKWFACEWAGVSPDLMCVGKALTGGVMSLAAVLATAGVAEVLSRDGGVFMHGPTFMANPLACAVAAANLETLAASPWTERVAELERGLEKGLAPAKGLAGVADVRVLGGMGVVEMEAPVAVGALQRFFVDRHEVWIRPFARLIYLMPPYTTPPAGIGRLAAAIVDAVRTGAWRPNPKEGN